MRASVRAFTLVELLIVIAIIVLLVAITAGSVAPVLKRAQQASCASQLRGLGQAYVAYATTTGRFPPLISNANSNLPPPFGAGTAYSNQFNYLIVFEGRFWAGYGPLAWTNEIPTDYYPCPAARNNKRDRWSSSNPNPEVVRREWPNNKGTSRADYSLRSYLDFRSPGWAQAQGKRALIADNIQTPGWVTGRHGDGVNVFYVDGSIDYRTDEILWNNGLTSSFTANNPELEDLWNALDANKQQ